MGIGGLRASGYGRRSRRQFPGSARIDTEVSAVHGFWGFVWIGRGGTKVMKSRRLAPPASSPEACLFPHLCLRPEGAHTSSRGVSPSGRNPRKIISLINSPRAAQSNSLQRPPPRGISQPIARDLKPLLEGCHVDPQAGSNDSSCWLSKESREA